MFVDMVTIKPAPIVGARLVRLSGLSEEKRLAEAKDRVEAYMRDLEETPQHCIKKRYRLRQKITRAQKIVEEHSQHGESDESRANARLIAAAPDLLSELKNAHLIIRNALRVMTPEQKSEWGRLNAHAGVEGEGVTRANEREAAISKATGEEMKS